MFNILDAQKIISDFINNHLDGIKTIHKIYYKKNDKLQLQSFIEELKNELERGCIYFLNKNKSFNEIDNYLFYIVNDYAKKNIKPIEKIKKIPICPGCEVFNKISFLKNKKMFYVCEVCENNFKSEVNNGKKELFKTFSIHFKNGFSCKDCNKFIPDTLEDILVCPYINCFFVGSKKNLQKINHPTINQKIKNLSVKENNIIQDSHENEILIKDEYFNKIKIIKEVIESQNNNVSYNSSDFTIKHKNLIYQSILNLINIYPKQMVDYLLLNSRTGGFQHKIFQEYINLLELSFPFSFKKKNKVITINNLLDKNLNIFDGISIFKSIINNNIIKNNTSEIYIGGRKGTIVKPFYIGKVLNILDENNKSLMSKIEEYSFNLIKLKEIPNNTAVTISHLRIIPHYQMGAMTHINRIRKKIVDRCKNILNI